MENIIKKAIEGGYNNLTVTQFNLLKENKLRVELFVLDPLFWQALGKACGWEWYCMCCGGVRKFEEFYCHNSEMNTSLRIGWCYNALEFHRVNLTQGFDKAVEWLNNLIEKKR